MDCSGSEEAFMFLRGNVEQSDFSIIFFFFLAFVSHPGSKFLPVLQLGKETSVVFEFVWISQGDAFWKTPLARQIRFYI